jgi:hypothetical protein
MTPPNGANKEPAGYTPDQVQLLEALGTLFPDGFLLVTVKPAMSHVGANQVNENALWAFAAQALGKRLMDVHMELKKQIEAQQGAAGKPDKGIVTANPDDVPPSPMRPNRRY